MLLEAEFGRRNDPVGDRQQAGVTGTMPAALDGDGFEAEIDRGHMRRRRETRLPQRLGGEKPAAPGRVLQHLQGVPGVEQQCGAKNRRRLAQHDAPFLQPFVLIPIEVVDQRILFPRTRGAGVFPSLIAASDRANTASIAASSASNGLPTSELSPLPSPVRPVVQLGAPGRLGARRNNSHAIGSSGTPQAAKPFRAQRPAGHLRSYSSAGFQDAAGDGQLMGWRPDVEAGVVQHEVFEMHQLAADPQRSARVGKMGRSSQLGPTCERAM